ncbi:MAG: glycosyltransferase family 4 protein [Candidatus Micrarchaeota archaeon]
MLNPFYYPYLGGTEKHLYEVCPRLAKKHDVTVLTSRSHETPFREEKDGVQIRRSLALVLWNLPYPLPPPLPITPLRWLDIKREAEKADVVHIHNRFVYGFADLFLLKKLLGKKLVMTLHNARTQGIDLATDISGQVYDGVIGHRWMKYADAIAAVSKNTLSITVPLEYQKKARPVYNGVNVKGFNPRLKGDRMREEMKLEGKRIILTVCRLIEQKGVEFLVDAAPSVLRKEKDAHFVVLGRGPRLESLERKAQQLGVLKNFSFVTERLLEKDLEELFAAADVFVLPSLWEPFGMVLCEAMACGKPVVGSRVGGIPEIVEEGKQGFLVEPRNPSALAEKIKLVLGDSRMARKMGAAGRKRVENNFTWDHTAAAYERIYNSL